MFVSGVPRLALGAVPPSGGWRGNGRTRRRGEIRAPAKPGVKLGAMHVKTQSPEVCNTEPRFKGWTRHVHLSVVLLKP